MLFLQAARHGPATNFPIDRIVMHGTVTPCGPHWAEAVANDFHTTTQDKSTQYVVDTDSIVQCVRDDTVAYGAPPNTHAIHIEQTDPQAGSPARWQDANHQAMLRLAAKLVASLCAKYHIPIVKLSAADLRAGKRGICGHKDVSDAWHLTDHVDPGPDYPWTQFLGLVRAASNPTPPAKKVHKMEWLAKTAGKNAAGQTYSAVFLCNGHTRKHVLNERHLLSIQERLRHFGFSDAIAQYAAGELAAGIAGVLEPGSVDADPGTY